MGVKMEYLIIGRYNDEFCCDVEQFKHFLVGNKRVNIQEDKLDFGHETFDYSIEQWDVERSPKETVFHLVISHTSAESSVIEKLDELDDFLNRLNIRFGAQFIINTVWDDVSSFYEERLYPKIARSERLLREIIYRFMIKAVGGSWYEKATPPKVKDEIGRTMEKRASVDEEQANNRQEDSQLYYADFIQLGNFLFAAYPLRRIDQRAIDKIRKALQENGQNLEGLLDSYDSKSNWDRYFADKIHVDDLEGKWRELYGYRNQVAHVKRMRRVEYERAMDLASEITGVFEDCLEQVENMDMSPEETAAIKEVAEETVGVRKNLDLFLKLYAENKGDLQTQVLRYLERSQDSQTHDQCKSAFELTRHYRSTPYAEVVGRLSDV